MVHGRQWHLHTSVIISTLRQHIANYQALSARILHQRHGRQQENILPGHAHVFLTASGSKVRLFSPMRKFCNAIPALQPYTLVLNAAASVFPAAVLALLFYCHFLRTALFCMTCTIIPYILL
jgi:hypothetical protein